MRDTGCQKKKNDDGIPCDLSFKTVASIYTLKLLDKIQSDQSKFSQCNVCFQKKNNQNLKVNLCM